jgi:hypothetical protein
MIRPLCLAGALALAGCGGPAPAPAPAPSPSAPGDRAPAHAVLVPNMT